MAVEPAAVPVADALGPIAVALATKLILAPLPIATPLLPFTEVALPMAMAGLKL